MQHHVFALPGLHHTLQARQKAIQQGFLGGGYIIDTAIKRGLALKQYVQFPQVVGPQCRSGGDEVGYGIGRAQPGCDFHRTR